MLQQAAIMDARKGLTKTVLPLIFGSNGHGHTAIIALVRDGICSVERAHLARVRFSRSTTAEFYQHIATQRLFSVQTVWRMKFESEHETED